MAVLALVAAALVPLVSQTAAPVAAAAPASCGSGCQVTVNATDFATGAALPDYSFIVSVDNSKLPSDEQALSTKSFSPTVATGSKASPNVTLPDGRYLITVRAPNHKMWGVYVNLPADAADNSTLTTTVALTEQSGAHPLKLGNLRIFVFEDNAWTNGAPDTEESTATGGLGGFRIGLKEQTGSAVTVDYNNKPLCGGVCQTAADGFVEIKDLGPATYFADVHTPAHCNPNPNAPNRLTTGPGTWVQTTTIDGGLDLMTPVEEGSDGTGAPGENLWAAPDRRTAYWFGFVCTPLDWPTTGPLSRGQGEITGQAKNWVEWAPYTTGTYNTPVENPYVALTDASSDTTVWVGQGDANGNIDIQHVPAGTYNVSIWDEQLTYIMRFKPITVTGSGTTSLDDTGDDGEAGTGVSRWFGWLGGRVYKDLNNNGQFDQGIDAPIANTDMDQRWRDGSIKENTVTDPNGFYEYPTAEGGALGRWIVNEQGFARFSAEPGPSAHDERTDAVTPSCALDTSGPNPPTPANPCVPTDQGGGLLSNQLLLEGHRATVDFGKRDYAPGTPGQIVGITYFATTRNEFDARFQAHEDYEPGIPGVTVLLETPGPDGLPNTNDDVVVNEYVTDAWQQPSSAQDPQADGNSFTQGCAPIKDFNGNDVTNQFAAKITPNCLEVPLTGQQTKDGAFDGGYAFSDYCPGGYNLTAHGCANGADPVPLVAGDYITHALMPKDGHDTRPCNNDTPLGHQTVTQPHGTVPGGGQGCIDRIVQEDDVNVDLGNHFTPQIPPPPCVGDPSTIDQATLTPRSNYFTGDQATSSQHPLCDKHLVQLQNGQNANADFFMMSNFRNDPNGQNPADQHAGDVAEPGRLVGQVFNDIYFETNKDSPWYGEPRPIGGIPVGIYARVDTKPNVNQPYDENNWRLLTTVTTSQDGSFEAVVPSTETFNCPIPQGPCPGMYLVKVDDAGSPGHANRNFDPNLLVATTPAEAWPGQTTQLDLPLDPISGTACDFSVGPDGVASNVPELLQVSRAALTDTTGAGNAAREVTLSADFIGPAGGTGAGGGHATLTDVRTGAVTTLTRANGGIQAWTPGSSASATSPGTPDSIRIRVPQLSSSFTPGPKQLAIVGANSNGGESSVNGITLHVMGNNLGVNYTPNVVNVAAPTLGGHQLQNAIDGASAGSLLLLAPGTYNENVLMWKPLKLQGRGPGGIIGARELQQRQAEDPRFNVIGTVVDGRFFQQNATAYTNTVNAHAPYAVDPAFPDIMQGAEITVAAKTAGAYEAALPGNLNQRAFYNARIDGLGLQTGQGQWGAGGVQLQANANRLQITNNIVENNGGNFAGGIALGQPYAHGNHNFNVYLGNDRILGNGGFQRSGGVGVFYGSNNYEVANSILCANYSVEYGAGLSHWGLSPSGSIHDNQIYYNDAVDSGAGVSIQSEAPVDANCAGPGATITSCRGTGSGAVDLQRNLIQSNYSGDDGGGLFISDSRNARINLVNNQMNNNGAADIGGAVMLDDAANVAIVNDTFANNVTTASSENSSIGVPHSAGLAAEKNDPLFQASLPAGSPDFSRPAALFNNIFWNNDAMTLTQFGPGAALVDQGFIDFEIHGSVNPADRLTPRFSDLTNGNILVNDVPASVPGGQGNLSGDPLFLTPFINELTVGGSRLDPQMAAVTITGQDPPVGLAGDYHLSVAPLGAASFSIDHGVRCSSGPPNANPCAAGATTAPNVDIDGHTRPQARSSRNNLWDLGADEIPTLGQ